MGLLDEAIREHLDLKRARGADPAEIERLEREALGPVRREPPIGSVQAEPELDPIGDYGAGAYDDDLPDGDDAPDDATVEPPQPRRRFLRRNRGAAPAPEEPESSEHDYALEHHEFIEHSELPEDDDFYDHTDDGDQDEAGDEPATELHSTLEPPQLTFDHPPKRPRFTAEPPGPDEAADDPDEPEDESTRDADAAAAPPAEQEHPASEAEHHAPPEPHHESQATREFAVEEVFDSEQNEDEDVLEETPEFLQDTPEHDRLWFEQRPPRDFDFDN